MKAMVLDEIGVIAPGRESLRYCNWPDPEPAEHDLLVRVSTCGVCHTELDEIEGRAAPSQLPMIPGHQVVGRVVARGAKVTGIAIGQRVGVAWIFSACGHCGHCVAGNENLCAQFRATGRDVHGGYAELMTVPAAFAHPIADTLSDTEAAPLLCAGAIGYRSVKLAGVRDRMRVGLTGFGASAHLVLKMIRHLHPDTQVFVFARGPAERAFALELGAAWAGDTAQASPVTLQAIIDTTPAWLPVVRAMECLEPGGRLVINAIRKEDSDKGELLRLDYPRHLWMEKEIKSVANITRNDVREFLALAARIPLRPEVETYGLADANRALLDLKTKPLRGAKVLCVG